MKKQIILGLLILAMLSVLSIGVSAASVSLTSPGNDTWASSNQPDFVFIPVSDVDTTLSCVLFINEANYGTNATAANYTTTTITASSSLADASYNWYINCTDAAGTAQSETRVLKVDFTLPVITSSSPADNAYTNNKSVTYTPSDSFLNTCEWYTINTSDASDISSGSASANNGVLNTQQLTLVEGSFYWHINCTDTAGNTGVSGTRTINYDATDPVISSTASGSISSSGATITWTTDESANSRVDYSTNVASSSSSSGSYTTSHSVGLSGLSASTTYNYNVTSCDQAGNCKTDSSGYSFNTSAAPSAPSTTTTAVSTWIRTPRAPLPVLNYYFTQQTKTVTLRTTDDIQFDVAGQRHKAKIKQIHDDYVTVTVSSTPQDVDLYLGQPVTVDLNDDNIHDIQLTLITFKPSNARIKFDAISEQVEPAKKIPAPAEVPKEEEPEEIREEARVSEPKAKAEAKPFKAGPLIGVLAAAAVIAAIIFAVLRKKK